MGSVRKKGAVAPEVKVRGKCHQGAVLPACPTLPTCHPEPEAEPGRFGGHTLSLFPVVWGWQHLSGCLGPPGGKEGQEQEQGIAKGLYLEGPRNCPACPSLWPWAGLRPLVQKEAHRVARAARDSRAGILPDPRKAASLAIPDPLSMPGPRPCCSWPSQKTLAGEGRDEAWSPRGGRDCGRESRLPALWTGGRHFLGQC